LSLIIVQRNHVCYCVNQVPNQAAWFSQAGWLCPCTY
jgi:hypothetical protein